MDTPSSTVATAWGTTHCTKRPDLLNRNRYTGATEGRGHPSTVVTPLETSQSCPTGHEKGTRCVTQPGVCRNPPQVWSRSGSEVPIGLPALDPAP